jgi:type II secretory pathway component HofQ
MAAIFLLSARSGAAQEVPRITASFDSIPIAEVVATFAAVSGRSIILGRGVEAYVTAEFHDVPWRVALEEVLEAHGLAAIEDSSGVITVVREVGPTPRRPASPHPGAWGLGSPHPPHRTRA